MIAIPSGARRERGVLPWGNRQRQRRFGVEACDDVLPHSFPMLPREDHPPFCLSLDDLETWDSLPAGGAPGLVAALQHYILTDPEGILRAAHIAGRPDANFQYLASRRLAGDKWQELATDLDLPLSTLGRFYQEHLQRLAPRFQDHLAP